MKILFYNYTFVEHPHLFPVAKEAKKRGHDILFVLASTEGINTHLKIAIEQKGYQAVVPKNKEEFQNLANDYDYIFYTEPLRIKYKPEKIKAIQIYHGVADKGGHYVPENESAWYKSFVSGEYEYNKLKEVVPEKMDNCHIVGCTKFDCDIIPKEKRKEGEKYKLLYAPTWNPAYSSLGIIGKELIQLTDIADISVKLHANIPVRSKQGKQWRDFFKQSPKFEYIQANENIIPYIAQSDVLVSDVSSVMFEALALEVPIIAINPKGNEKVEGRIEWDWRSDQILTANNIEELRKLLNFGPTYYKDQQKLIKKVFKYFIGASRRILDILEKDHGK